MFSEEDQEFFSRLTHEDIRAVRLTQGDLFADDLLNRYHLWLEWQRQQDKIKFKGD